MQQAVVPYQMVNKNKILTRNDQSVSDSVFQSLQNEVVFEIQIYTDSEKKDQLQMPKLPYIIVTLVLLCVMILLKDKQPQKAPAKNIVLQD